MIWFMTITIYLFLAVDWSARRRLQGEEWLPAGLPRRLTGYPQACTEIMSGIKKPY
ncbi:hypothetical protein [Rossellomorea marisflavi]|uniref:hypothetical protein n=1 Tax=Rossellomorea marisflavi TaxID=189381 RepID=UPI0013648A5B|nr:hypothetical protein [Rossellomorea marisflavi]